MSSCCHFICKKLSL